MWRRICRRWITAAGWKSGGYEVVDGSTIDLTKKQAVVYGFSCSFGKVDHVRAANMIKEWVTEMLKFLTIRRASIEMRDPVAISVGPIAAVERTTDIYCGGSWVLSATFSCRCDTS
jgi:hypothetical protein